MRPEGFELTIHQSAIKPQLVAGIPRQLALVLYTLMAALTFPLGTWYAIPPGLFLHLVFVAAATCPISTGVAEQASPGMEWCSASQ